jgi:hypothetical protein
MIVHVQSPASLLRSGRTCHGLLPGRRRRRCILLILDWQPVFRSVLLRPRTVPSRKRVRPEAERIIDGISVAFHEVDKGLRVALLIVTAVVPMLCRNAIARIRLVATSSIMNEPRLPMS